MKISAKETKGITLIALVITIIILLILAGISIVALGGENGLFARAKQAKNNTLDAQNAENNLLMGYEDIINEQIGEQKQYPIENEKSEAQIFIETAGIEYNYTSLDDFVTNSSDEQKQILTSNDAAMDYLRTHSSLISELKSTSNYKELVTYLLNIDSSINMSNYNVGLPCYISKGNKVYLGTSWELVTVSGHGSLDTSDSNRISLYLIADEQWCAFVRTKDKFSTSGYSAAVINASVSYVDDATRCSFGSGDNGYTALKEEGGSAIIKDVNAKNYTMTNFVPGTYYFGMSVAYIGTPQTAYLYESYIY